jgi:hypothetical protein
MSKFMYGVEFLREMDPRDPDHVARKERLCELPSGPKLLPDAFDCILARVSFFYFYFLSEQRFQTNAFGVGEIRV